MEQRRQTGRLVLAAVPIGDPQDASPRLCDLLATADVIAAEDTRRLRRLAAALGVVPAGRVVSYYDAVEAERTPALLDALAAGSTVALVTDAGTPVVSDPGYRLVRGALAAGFGVTALPGPSAVTTALAVSGLASERFCFEGFLPRKAGERRRRIDSLAGEPRTMVLFEAPHRLAATLADLAAGLGEQRPAACCRELTKTFEEVRRGTLGELAAWAAAGVRGEVTVVVGGAPPAAPVADPSAWVAAVAAAQRGGLARNAAIAAVAREAGVQRRAVYDAVVAAKAVAADH